jgi:outer membrane usher protein FimD/PapC
MSMSEYLSAREQGNRTYSSKELYTLTFNKQFRDIGLSAYLNYNHQSYWDRPDSDSYDLSLARYFDIGNYKNLSVSLSGYRRIYNEVKDDGMYLSLSMPWGDRGSLRYNASVNKRDNTQSIGYYNRIDDNNNYQISAGTSRQGMTGSGYFSHLGDKSEINLNASYQENSYSSFGMSLRGGLTATTQGAALHRSNTPGGTRLLLDTDGVANVPVRGYGANANTNIFGKAVVTDVGSYYRTSASIDLDKLGDNVEATRSVAQVTLTEGAIGYRKFDVIAGEKTMATVRLADGSAPPFGATVQNAKQQETGIITDDGSVYLSGINAGEQMTVHWNGEQQCSIALPQTLPQDLHSQLLLPCGAKSEN